MKKIFILLFPIFCQAQSSQVAIQFPDSVMVIPGSLNLSGCISLCSGNPSTIKWTDPKNLGLVFSAPNNSSTSVSGFRSGLNRIAFDVVDGNGKLLGDTLNLYMYPPAPPCPVCPICPICPAIPPQRSAKSIIYSDGSVQNIP